MESYNRCDGRVPCTHDIEGKVCDAVKQLAIKNSIKEKNEYRQNNEHKNK